MIYYIIKDIISQKLAIDIIYVLLHTAHLFNLTLVISYDYNTNHEKDILGIFDNKHIVVSGLRYKIGTETT